LLEWTLQKSAAKDVEISKQKDSASLAACKQTFNCGVRKNAT